MAKSLFDLNGKVTLVTGGNGGLGLAFARGVARQGSDVVIWGRSEEKNARAKGELESLGARVATRQVDVASEQAIIDGYAALKAEFGRIDTVFANAGMAAAPGSALTLPSDDYYAFIQSSLHGAYFTLREGARLMVERAEAGEPGGSLVACGSLSMYLGLPGMPHYAGSKAALGAIIRGMAVDFGRYRIRANVVAPGLVATDMTGGEESDAARHMAQISPLPRVGLPEDFEAIAAYLASDGASFHTGDTIVIDGGYMVRPF